MHHIFGKDTGETLSRLMLDTSDATAWGSLEDALKNLDVEKRGLDLTTDAGKRRLAVIQDTENRILKGKDVTGRTLTARKTGETFPISRIRTEKFKLERPARKGKLGYEKFSIDDAGKVTQVRKGADLSKTVAAQHWDDVKSLANVDFKTLEKGSPEWTKIRKVMENAYGDIGKTINNLNSTQIATICRAIRALPGFSSGGSAKCITKINRALVERPDDLMRSLASISKPSGKLKGVINMAKTLGKLLKVAGIASIPLDVVPLVQARDLGIDKWGAVGGKNLAETYANLPGMVWEGGRWVKSKLQGKDHEWKLPYEAKFGQRATAKALRETSVEDLIANIKAQGESAAKNTGVAYGQQVLDPLVSEEEINKRIEKTLKLKAYYDSNPDVLPEKEEKKPTDNLTGVDKYILSNLDV